MYRWSSWLGGCVGLAGPVKILLGAQGRRQGSRMRLVEIARYPVKSLQGELLSSAEIEPDGVRGDRGWGIRDETTGKILTGRRAAQLLFAAR
jgi:hypothetical protein